MLKVLLFLLVVAAAAGLSVRWLGSRIVFYPTRVWEVAPGWAGPGSQELNFSTEDGLVLSGLWLPGREGRGVLVYCHGNAGNLSHRIPTAVAWRDRFGCSIFLFDYRGYGRSQGTPSEKGIFLDTQAAFREAQRLAGEVPILFGRSLGTWPAIRLAG
ncbi:MAG: alpha/beta hydrolase, partial [Acidobacteriota bacterium]